MVAKGLDPVVIIRRILFDIFVYPYYSLPSFWPNAGMMEFGSNKANRANNKGITVLNQIHETWERGMFCMMELFLHGRSYFILCLSCVYDGVGHHVIVILYFMIRRGHLTL